MSDIERKARQLLASEMERSGRKGTANKIRQGRPAMFREELRAIIAALTPPEGWVLMPRVLTEEMLQAGYPADDAQEGYEAMIAARPEVK